MQKKLGFDATVTKSCKNNWNLMQLYQENCKNNWDLMQL